MAAEIALADTSFFIGRENGRPFRTKPPRRYRISTVTVAELRLGLLVTDEPDERAKRLDTLTKAMETEPLPVDDRVANAWAELRLAMRGGKKKLKTNDSWIAATAIAHGLPVATQDDNYDDVPGLEVIKL